MRFVIDQIENGKAVLEDENRNTIIISIELLDNESKEGDIVVFDSKQSKYHIDKIETERKRKRLKEKMNNLWKL